MCQFSHSVDAAHFGGRWIESSLGQKCLYEQIYQILLAVDNSSPAIYIYIYKFMEAALRGPQLKCNLLNICAH